MSLLAILRRAVLIGTVTVLLAGCGGSHNASSRPSLPACAKAGHATSIPSDFPAMFPLPPGTVVSLIHRSAGALTVQGVSPTEFKQAVAFFQRELPAAGFQLGEGDAEQDEAESSFSGHGVTGRWRVNGILQCPNAVTLTVAVLKG